MKNVISFHWGILNKNNKYTNLGLLISDENPVVVKFAKYDSKLDFIIKKEFTGSIIKITDQVMEYAELLNTTSAIIPDVGGRRIETKSFPGKSLREAIVNAICHADYFKPSNIKLEFYDNRVEITSPGGILDGDLDLILKGYQTFRNPGLVRVLALFNYIENYGKGLKRIQEAYAGQKRKFQFDVNETYFRIILPDLNYKSVEEQVNEQVNEQENLSKNAKKLFEIIKENKISNYAEMSQIMGLSLSSVRRAVDELKKKHLVYKDGSDKTGSWKIIKKI